MSRSKDRRSTKIRVEDAMTHNPFAQALGHAASQDDAPQPSPPEPAPTPSPSKIGFATKVVLRREKKARGGKTVTRIDGVLGPAEALDQAARSLGKALGARAFVQEGSLWVSGDQCQAAQRWLTQAGATRIVIGN